MYVTEATTFCLVGALHLLVKYTTVNQSAKLHNLIVAMVGQTAHAMPTLQHTQHWKTMLHCSIQESGGDTAYMPRATLLRYALLRIAMQSSSMRTRHIVTALTPTHESNPSVELTCCLKSPYHYSLTLKKHDSIAMPQYASPSAIDCMCIMLVAASSVGQ